MPRCIGIPLLSIALSAWPLPPSVDTSSTAKQATPQNEARITITGYLEDSETGAGMEIAVMNAAGDYQNYIVSEKGLGREIKKQIGQLVKIIGFVQADSKKRKTILIEQFEVLKSPSVDSILSE